ncbi:MAG: hypothetical protein IKB88_04985 [Clostridia bacterium]|nr:hypothetical protein [Clostridia bacterium]
MSQKTKLLLGTFINIISGIAGFIFWVLFQDSVSMKSSVRDIASTAMISAIFPVVVAFVFWFTRGKKNKAMVGKPAPSMLPYFLGGAIATLVIPVVGIFLFPKAIAFAIATSVIAIIGSLVSYLTCKP